MPSLSEHKCPPVVAGIKLKRIASSNCFKNSSNDGIVCIKYVSFPLKLSTKAEYQDCGSDSPIMGKNFNFLIQSCAKDFASEILNALLSITAPKCCFPSNVTFTLLLMKT